MATVLSHHFCKACIRKTQVMLKVTIAVPETGTAAGGHNNKGQVRETAPVPYLAGILYLYIENTGHMTRYLPLLILFFLIGCIGHEESKEITTDGDTTLQETAKTDHTESKPALLPPRSGIIETGMITPEEVVAFAKTQIGVPYLYASTDPEKGFDCSGFITYVFNHFNIPVPRSSIDFTDKGTEIDTSEARAGDLILFTGTDSTVRIVGHMGLVVNNDHGRLEFIHSTSGKAKGVVITPFERYYRGRFVKVIRVFPTSH